MLVATIVNHLQFNTLWLAAGERDSFVCASVCMSVRVRAFVYGARVCVSVLGVSALCDNVYRCVFL